MTEQSITQGSESKMQAMRRKAAAGLARLGLSFSGERGAERGLDKQVADLRGQLGRAVGKHDGDEVIRGRGLDAITILRTELGGDKGLDYSSIVTTSSKGIWSDLLVVSGRPITTGLETLTSGTGTVVDSVAFSAKGTQNGHTEWVALISEGEPRRGATYLAVYPDRVVQYPTYDPTNGGVEPNWDRRQELDPAQTEAFRAWLDNTREVVSSALAGGPSGR